MQSLRYRQLIMCAACFLMACHSLQVPINDPVQWNPKDPMQVWIYSGILQTTDSSAHYGFHQVFISTPDSAGKTCWFSHYACLTDLDGKTYRSGGSYMQVATDTFQRGAMLRMVGPEGRWQAGLGGGKGRLLAVDSGGDCRLRLKFQLPVSTDKLSTGTTGLQDGGDLLLNRNMQATGSLKLSGKTAKVSGIVDLRVYSDAAPWLQGGRPVVQMLGSAPPALSGFLFTGILDEHLMPVQGVLFCWDARGKIGRYQDVWVSSEFRPVAGSRDWPLQWKITADDGTVIEAGARFDAQVLTALKRPVWMGHVQVHCSGPAEGSGSASMLIIP